ncbi:MAG: metallophosphoesterase [candidate division KSB1 bacterium]|nr:metallophosphoesterase [candidate division KSB1 bacterium]MDZ7303301.1 metallophosphoesterase [candidate division KSB1 bacterium]MDZ7312603.1 metallophosphoesterase [candidate division KSB1 bacterium]
MSWFLRMTLFVLPAILAAYAYVGWRIAAALGQLTSWPRPTIRWSTIAIAGYLNLYPLLLLATALLQMTAANSALRGGRRWLDMLFTFPFWGGLIVVLEVLPLLLVIDLARFPLWPLFQKYRPNWMQWQAIITVSLVAIIVVYVAVRVGHDTYSVRLTAREVRIPALPADLEGFRIVQLSDLQADPYTDERKMQRYLDLANAQKPDLILFAGDLVTRGTGHIAQGANMMGRLRARLGVYACLGDHDFWVDPRSIMRHLQGNGVTTIDDSVVTIAASSSRISLTVITNIYDRRPSASTLEHLRRRRPEAAVHILLSHQPTDDIIRFAQNHDYHLLLAGHTHGGQLVFKPFGISLCASQIETRYYSGFHQIGNLVLSVTNGLGLTFAPFRYQAPAEVTLITLRRAR